MKILLGAFILIHFFSVFCTAQITITGRVTDKETAAHLPYVNIVVKNKEQSKLITAVQADEEGRYQLQLTSSTDSVFFKVSFLGYKSLEMLIPSRTQQINVLLEPSSFILKEVVVNKEAIYEIGDTLSYQVSAFKSQDDQVIGDLIKRLPGISMESDGTIKYQGRAINKYYIEGLDMLEGRYGLANQNIRVEDINTVDIYQNHQPIRVLDSLEFSDQAALNLTLKNKHTRAYAATVGAGIEPILGKVDLTGLLFKVNSQFISTIKANNIGEEINRNINQLTDIPLLQNNDYLKLGIVRPTTPSFDTKRWLKNEDVLGTFNSLRRLKNSTQLKTFLTLGRRLSNLNGTSATEWFDNNKMVASLIENRASAEQEKLLSAEMVAEKNMRESFTKNKLTFGSKILQENGLTNLQNSGISQTLRVPEISLSNSFQQFAKLRSKLYVIRVATDFSSINQRLLVWRDSSFNIKNQTLNQDLTHQQFTNGINIGSKLKLARFLIDYQVGSNFKKHRATSNFIATTDYTTTTNDVKWTQNDSFLEGKSATKINEWHLSVSSRLTHTLIRALGLSEANSLRKNYLYFEPQVLLYGKFNHFWQAEANLRRSIMFGNIDHVSPNNILVNYREFRIGSEVIPRKRFNTASLSINYKDVVKNNFGGYSVTFNTIRQNVILENAVLPTGELFMNYRAFINDGWSLNHLARWSKYWPRAKTNLDFKAVHITTLQQVFVNGILGNYRIHTFMPKFTLTSQPIEKLKWVAEAQFVGSKTTSDLTNLQTNSQSTLTGKLLYFPNQSFTFQVQNDTYFTQLSNGQKSINRFLNIDMILKMNRKIDQVRLTLNNILNEKYFSMVQNQTFLTNSTNFQIRPFQVFCTARLALR